MEEKSEPIKKPNVIGFRHLMILLMFLCCILAYATRVSMSVGIVAMTTSNDHGYQIFDWSKAVQDIILSSFFWGYVILQIPAGIIANLFGSKLLLTVAMICNGVFNMFIPIAAAKGGWMAVCGCRIILGLSQGLIYPSLHGLLGKWCPPDERGRLGTIVYAGSLLGTVIEMIAAGWLSATSWGWPSVFYTVGATNLIWALVWLILGSNTPSQSKFISKEEETYIVKTTTVSGQTNQKMSIPWSKIWTSLPFWSVIIAHAGQSFGFWTLLTEMPSYMSKILGVDIKSNGLYSSLPYLAMYILSFVFSWLSDISVNRSILSVTAARKIANTIAFWGPAIFLLALCYLPSGHVGLAVLLLSITVGLNGSHYVGFLIVHIDIAPNFASILMGITNGIGNILSIVAPLSVSLVVKDEYLAEEWRKVFFLAIGIYFLSNLFFLLFGTSKRQAWNECESLINAANLEKGHDANKGQTVPGSQKKEMNLQEDNRFG